jgi:hypothetical protein
VIERNKRENIRDETSIEEQHQQTDRLDTTATRRRRREAAIGTDRYRYHHRHHHRHRHKSSGS